MEPTWIVDPIDGRSVRCVMTNVTGTTNFVHSFPFTCGAYLEVICGWRGCRRVGMEVLVAFFERP